MKKLLSLILAVLLLFGALPLTVSAADADAAATGSILIGYTDNCKWTFDSDTGVLTIEGSGMMDLPEYFVRDEIVDGKYSVKKVVVGEGITSVGGYVFYGAYALEEVVLPSTITEIYSHAFQGCNNLTTINFPPNLIEIYGYAFVYCTSLTSITLNEGLQEIMLGVFSFTGLTSVRIPASVTKIGRAAFDRSIVIYGYKGTAAETYAKDRDITFRSLISSVEVTVDEPVAGQTPSTIASAPDGAGYNAYVMSWCDEDKNNEFGTFEPGKDYSVMINVSAAEGYAFDTSHPLMQGKLNGGDCMFTVSGEGNVYAEDTYTCPVPPPCTLCGSFTSFMDTAGITIELLQDGEQKYSASYQDDCGSYTLNDVVAGKYTLRVSKKNHVTRDYAINVKGTEMTQDVAINPVGDVDGDGVITNFDYGRVNSHARGKSTLTDYAFFCADVDGDGVITNFDAGKVNSHARGKSSLWT